MNDLKSILSALEIRAFEDEDGNYSAVSNSEPAFCFIRESQEELRHLVASTLKSYAKRFHNVDLEVEISAEELSAPRTVRLEQRSKFRPSFGLGTAFGDLVPALGKHALVPNSR